MRFADYGKRVVFAAFDGGEITSDAGVLLLRERARRIRLFERMAGCFTDHRDRERLTHTLPALLAQRVCGMALGYEDIIDHDTLRFDPALKLLASPGTEYPGTPAPLAGKSTLNRLEQSWENGNRRYHQMVPNLKKLSNLFVTLFLDAHQTPSARITLDIDATDVETHGRQENAFFHGYYEHRCFLPVAPINPICRRNPSIPGLCRIASPTCARPFELSLPWSVRLSSAARRCILRTLPCDSSLPP